jgi:DNA-binding MarR family transcriptional regulator
MVSGQRDILSKFITSYPRILVAVMKKQPISISDVNRVTGITYSHLQKSVIDLSGYGLIRRRHNGRVVNLYLTDEGAIVAKDFAHIITKMQDMKEAG